MIATKYRRFLWEFLEECSIVAMYNSPFFIIMEQFSSEKVMSLLETIAVTCVSAAIGELESPLPSYLGVHSPITRTGFTQKKVESVTQKKKHF
jgi:hypothetical protein